MPVENKPLPPIQDEVIDYLSPDVDLVAQVREATYSPSPLIRILQDPTILPTESTNNSKQKGKRTSRSRSGPREHRSPMVAAIAIAEEERQAKHLKALLRSSGDRLEYEMRRAEDATVRAEFSERQEQDALARAKAAEAAKEQMKIDSMRLERDTRNYQIQLEAAQRETRRLQEDLAYAQRETEELQHSEARAQELLRKYQIELQDFETQVQRSPAEMQRVVDKCYEDGRQDGYDEGYESGYEDGRKAGLKEGLRKGRREGVKEGREQGRNEERRNALEAFDKFLAEEMNENDEHRSERTRRWAQSIYRADGYSESASLDPLDSGSQQL